jgi:flagellar hook-associated protein 1
VSISASLNNALSGLTASARTAELISNNVANATNPAYARREIVLGARVVGDTGQGVSVVGVDRIVDRALLSDRRPIAICERVSTRRLNVWSAAIRSRAV